MPRSGAAARRRRPWRNWPRRSPAARTPPGRREAAALTESLDRFLAALPETERRVFLRRYWFMDPIAAIGARYGFSQSKVRSMLARTRSRLRQHLEKEGFL